MVFDPCSAGFLIGPQNRQFLGESLGQSIGEPLGESLGESLRESLGQFLDESLRQVLASSPFLKPLVQMCHVSCIQKAFASQWLRISARPDFLWALKT